MRKWGTEHPYLLAALALAVVWGAGVSLWVSLGHSPADALLGSLFTVIFVVLSWYFSFRRHRKIASELSARGQVVVYVRYPNSRPGSLSGIWNRGVATFEPGRIAFQPAVYDTLEPSGRPTTFTVLEVDTQVRRIRHQDSKYIGELGFQAMTFTTEREDVELAASLAALQRIRDVVIGPGQ